MTSYKSKIDSRRQMFVRLIGDAYQEIQDAFAQENEENGVTQSDIARALNKDKGFVSRRLSGQSNMTLETLADFAWALDREIVLKLLKPEDLVGHDLNHKSEHVLERLTDNPTIKRTLKRPSDELTMKRA